jgi:ankyrin repeat protein
MRDDKLKFQSVQKHKIVIWMLIFICRKRIGQEKSSENLGPRPNELRPNPKDPKEMFERMKKFYISKRYLEERSRGNVLKQPSCPYPLGEAALGDLEALENQLEEEYSSGTFNSSGTSSYQFVEALENFAQNVTDEPEQRSTESGIERRIRTSYESLQSLRRRINERKAKEGQKLREYSYEELVKYLFIKRLSVGSLPSNRSTTSSLLSKQSSDGPETSTSTSIRHSSTTLLSTSDDVVSLSSGFHSLPNALGNASDYIKRTPSRRPFHHLFEARRPKPAAPNANISGPAIQFTTNMAFGPSHDFNHNQPQAERDLRQREIINLERHSTSDDLNTDNADTMTKVEGFPHFKRRRSATLERPSISLHEGAGKYLRPANLGRFIQADAAPANTNQLPRQICCVNQCRGDPRADKCLFCLFDVPEAHFCVRSLVEQWRAGEDIFTAFAARPVAIDFGEVDDFGDTVLHLASSLGAGSIILCWLISMGVSVHAKNAAGQTFMHFFDPVSFARGHHREIMNFGTWNAGEGDMKILLNTLQGMNFDFNARDDFGQTPMHVLTRYWLPAYTMQLAFDVGMVGGTSLYNMDFLGRSVESQIRSKANVDHNGIFDQQRAIKAEALLYSAKPLMTGSNQLDLPLLETHPRVHGVLYPNASLGMTIIQATSGFPETRYRGRNSLHCLAESCISLQLRPDDKDTNNSSLKRKRQTDFTLRHEYIVNTVKELLKGGVDVNEYDKYGNTPVMSFIRNDLSPKPERKITAEVLQLLINAGASVHRRNRKGETALHIAMRLGRPSAVEVLLNNYANVHARARHGDGVLAVAGKASLKAKQDGALYHRIITCMAIAGKYGAVLGPSTKNEWDRQRKCVHKEGPVIIDGPGVGEEEITNVQ